MANNPKTLRCAIYTRKSTEHGLELEFNSLDAQREACEAYIKSQASQGWRVLPQHYDDPAYSGGNLDRPALKRLLDDIHAGQVDVVVVYKIDRLTRSLADFAKLVEAFDARSISFVAVTQQFNTTTSMGRLTLNVLLSFAQFERELSSERVRDKIAASRRKGKWTGGSVPLGYDARDKKLVVNKAEVETVRTIFRRYLDLQSFGKVIEDLNRRGIVTKRRDTKVPKFRGGIPFTYGPLDHLLKNRIYCGEVHHGGKWFTGEHEAIINRKTFDRVQQALRANVTKRKAKALQSDALLLGKLYDDRGNLMSPSFSVKNGVRYRFYVSSVLLRGRKGKAGSVGRVSAITIETAIAAALRSTLEAAEDTANADLIPSHLVRAELRKDRIALKFTRMILDQSPKAEHRANAEEPETLQVAWHAKSGPASPQPDNADKLQQPDQTMLQAIARAHGWIQALTAGEFTSIDALAESIRLHPKVVRNEIKLAFLAPEIVDAILSSRQTFALADLRKIDSLSWPKQITLLANGHRVRV